MNIYYLKRFRKHCTYDFDAYNGSIRIFNHKTKEVYITYMQHLRLDLADSIGGFVRRIREAKKQYNRSRVKCYQRAVKNHVPRPTKR